MKHGTNTIIVCNACRGNSIQAVQQIVHRLRFQQEVQVNLVWDRAVMQDLGIDHIYSDFYFPDVEHDLGLAPLAEAVRNIPASVTNASGLSQLLTIAGCLCSGEGGGGGTGTPPVSAIFDSTTAKGMVVYVSSNGHVDLALADDYSTAGVVGFCNAAVSADNVGEYVTEGPMDLDDWTAVAGTASLSPGAVYFLDEANAGMITTSAPEDGGECVTVVGRATTENSLDIEIATPILLSGASVLSEPTVPTYAVFDDNTEIGQPVYVSGSGSVALAQADAEATSGVIGLAIQSVNATEEGFYTTDGQVEREDWTVVTGTEFLTPGALYYLDTSSAGLLTTTAPDDIGESVVVVGRALTGTMMDIEIDTPMLLN